MNANVSLDSSDKLLRQGFAVTATDIAVEALRHGRQVAPAAQHVQHDLRTPLSHLRNHLVHCEIALQSQATCLAE